MAWNYKAAAWPCKTSHLGYFLTGYNQDIWQSASAWAQNCPRSSQDGLKVLLRNAPELHNLNRTSPKCSGVGPPDLPPCPIYHTVVIYHPLAASIQYGTCYSFNDVHCVITACTTSLRRAPHRWRDAANVPRKSLTPAISQTLESLALPSKKGGTTSML